MRFKQALLFFAMSVPLLAISGIAGAQSSDDLSNRLSRIENELQTMSRAVYKGQNPASSASVISGGGDAAESLVKVQELEAQIQTLTGKIEEQGFLVEQLKNKIDRMSADYELRLKDLEGHSGGALNATQTSSMSGAASVGGGTGGEDLPQPNDLSGSGAGYKFSTNNVITAPEASSSVSSSESATSASSLPVHQSGNALGTISEGTPSGAGGLASSGDPLAAAYENAFSLLKAGNYDAAEKEFDAFVQKNPDHVLAGNAKYWLGETYYARGNYEKAARVFAEAYQKYPDGSKAADNLLKLGLSLSATGNNPDACVAFRQLEKNYQNGAGPVLRRAQQEMSKLGC